MATLNIRNLPADVHSRLRVRAARSGRSMEAEARAILGEACGSAATSAAVASLPAWVDSLFRGQKPRNVVDDLIDERRRDAGDE